MLSEIADKVDPDEYDKKIPIHALHVAVLEGKAHSWFKD